MHTIDFLDVAKCYAGSDSYALKHFDLHIAPGECIVIVGPSGSGKSTLLELICGFETLSTGDIRIDGVSIVDKRPSERQVAMVFQNYALLPHLTVYENIAFGMKVRKEAKDKIKQKVAWAANLLELEPYLKKKPQKLSGGQRQRVALARAIVREPSLFLMDEPLSNLDAKLRESMCREIKQLQQALGVAMLYVTHDQVEAMTLADRIVILNKGKVQQCGTPHELYHQPANVFVAQFIGRPSMNLLGCRRTPQGLLIEETDELVVDVPFLEGHTPYWLGVRSEALSITDEAHGHLEGTVLEVNDLGSETLLYLQYKKHTLIVKCYDSKADYPIGSRVQVRLDLDRVHYFNQQTEDNIRR